MTSSSLRFQRPSKQTLFFILMALSVVLLFLPSEILRPVRHLTDLIALAQWPASQASRKVADLRTLGNSSITAEEHAALTAELLAKRNLTDSLKVQVSELEAKVKELAHVRTLPGFPRDGRLIPADIISADAVASRGSLQLSKGSTSKVRAGDPVTSRLFVDAGSKDGAKKNALVLGHETLIGWVDETEGFTSRVLLLSDTYAKRLIVNIVREQKDGPPLVVSMDSKSIPFALQGAGSGMMKILEVNARFVEQGFVRVGDVVMSDPNDGRLPVSLVIGEITALDKGLATDKKPLYYTAMVKHRYDPRMLGRVFIADFSRPTEAGKEK